jgi:hypothetical protein
VNCKKEALDSICRDYNKDLLSVKCMPHAEHVAQIILEVISYNDVFLPITDTCFINISSTGSFKINDPFAIHLKNLEKTQRDNLIRDITMKIMKCILPASAEVRYPLMGYNFAQYKNKKIETL